MKNVEYFYRLIMQRVRSGRLCACLVIIISSFDVKLISLGTQPDFLSHKDTLGKYACTRKSRR